MKKVIVFFAVLLVGLGYICASGALGQSVQGVITGTITDPSGSVVPNASVTITNTGTNVSQTRTTDAKGVYRFPLVPPGTYLLDVKATSFAETKAAGIVVQASQTVPFDVKLQLAKAQTVVEVTSQAPLVQTATSNTSLQIDHTTIETAALVDRDVLGTLPFLAPDVTMGLDLMPAAGGARESGTSYMLNGSEDNDNFDEGGISVHPPLESIQDFSVITNNMSAEYGRGAGAVVTANQKSGTNNLHGALYEFNRNALLNANDYFYDRNIDNLEAAGQSLAANGVSLRPKYIKNQFGGEVDGPVIKNKTFFSFAYDRAKLLSGSTSANTFVPTSAAVAFLQANGGPIAQQILKARPPVTSDVACPATVAPAGTTGAGTTNGLPNTVGCLSFFDPRTDTTDTYFGRVDHNFSSADRLSFSANVVRHTFNDKFGGAPLTTIGPIASFTLDHDHILSLTETHVFAPTLVNEVTVGHNRFGNFNGEGNGAADTLPNIFIDNQNEGFLSYQLGGDGEGGQIINFPEDRWSADDNLTWTKGNHSVKFGGGGTYGIFYRNWNLGLPGQYEFGELYSVDPTCNTPGNVVTPACDGTLQPDGTIANVTDETRANFAGEYPYFQETNVDPATGAQGNAYRHYTYHDYYAFVQDDWKVSSRLTFNLGLRWDRYGAPGEVHNLIGQFTNFNGGFSCNILDPTCVGNARVGPVTRMWPTNNHDFAPRVGFAWDPFGNGTTAIRGGYGIFYDRIFDNVWSNGAWNPPYYALIDFEADLGDAVFYSNPGSIGAAYNPNGPCGPIPYGPNPATGCTGDKRVSVRTMDQHMRDSSGQNFYFGIEHQFFGGLLLRANYQGSLGRHLPMLENFNREDGIAANSKLSPVRPNPLYTGFNYRSNSVTSNYNALVVEAQKHMGHGLEFETSYTYSKLLDVNSELFAGCSAIGSINAPYYYISNADPRREYGRGAYDHRHAYKFNFIYNLPFAKSEHGLVGHAFGGWTVSSMFQMYAGHPFDVFDGRTRYRARDASGNLVLDADGVPINLGGDYNLDGVNNDHPVFVGSSISAAYSNGNPANGVFKDNNVIGCGAPWVPATVANIGACDARFGVVTPNSLFVTPAYPTSGPTFERFGPLGRNVFQGPRFIEMDASINKDFNFTERQKLEFRFEAQNVFNHPNFDGVDSNLGSGTFGQALLLTPFGLGTPKSRVMSVGLRYAF